MRSRRRSTFATAFVISLVLAAPGATRAQFAVPAYTGNPALSPFGAAYGAVVAYGLSPVDYGDSGCVNCGGYGAINPGVGLSDGRGGLPQARTTHSYQSISNAIGIVPGRDGPPRRARRHR